MTSLPRLKVGHHVRVLANIFNSAADGYIDGHVCGTFTGSVAGSVVDVAEPRMGRKVRKLFNSGWFNGTVTGYDDQEGWYKVRYDDDDEEELDESELKDVMVENRLGGGVRQVLFDDETVYKIAEKDLSFDQNQEDPEHSYLEELEKRRTAALTYQKAVQKLWNAEDAVGKADRYWRRKDAEYGRSLADEHNLKPGEGTVERYSGLAATRLAALKKSVMHFDVLRKAAKRAWEDAKVLKTTEQKAVDKLGETGGNEDRERLQEDRNRLLRIRAYNSARRSRSGPISQQQRLDTMAQAASLHLRRFKARSLQPLETDAGNLKTFLEHAENTAKAAADYNTRGFIGAGLLTNEETAAMAANQERVVRTTQEIHNRTSAEETIRHNLPQNQEAIDLYGAELNTREDEQKGFIGITRPEGFDDALICSITPYRNEVLWAACNRLYVHAQRDRETDIIMVDYGPYFDFPGFVPNHPENVDEYMHHRRVGWADPPWVDNETVQNGRYRRYVSLAVQRAFKITILSTGFLGREENAYLLNMRSPKIWDRNQFLLWWNQTKAAERIYVNCVKLYMRRKANDANFVEDNFAGWEEGGAAQGQDRKSWREAPAPAEFIAWLHQPVLRNMHRQRELITGGAGCNINEYSSWKANIRYDNPAALVATLQQRITGSLNSLYNVFDDAMRRIKDGFDEAAWQQGEAHEHDDDDNDQDDQVEDENVEQNEVLRNEGVGTDRQFPLQSDLAFHWTNVMPSLNIWSDVELYMKVARMTRVREPFPGPEPALVWPNEMVDDEEARFAPRVEIASCAEAEGVFFSADEYNQIGDVFDRVLNCDLLVSGQSGSVMSYVGTRVHFRISMIMSGNLNAGPVPDGQNWIPLEDHRAFFPATNAPMRDPEPPAKTIFAREDVPIKKFFIKKEVRRFMLADSALEGQGDEEPQVEQIPFKLYTRFMTYEQQNGFPSLRRVIDRTGGDAGPNRERWTTESLHIIGVEVPLFNPFCLYQASAKHARYKFFCTQCDFVALALQKTNEAVAPRERVCVVMGEFKTLMERRSPWGRVKDTSTLSQTMANAGLFEMQTGVEVDYALQIYMTRRDGDGMTCYAACTALRDFGTPAEPNGQKRVQLKRNISTELRIKEQKHPGIAIFDGTHTCVFNKGFRDKHEKQKKNPSPAIPVDPIPNLRMLADGLSYDHPAMEIDRRDVAEYDREYELGMRGWLREHYDSIPESTPFWQQTQDDNKWYEQVSDADRHGVFHPTCLKWTEGLTSVKELKVKHGIHDYVSVLEKHMTVEELDALVAQRDVEAQRRRGIPQNDNGVNDNGVNNNMIGPDNTGHEAAGRIAAGGGRHALLGAGTLVDLPGHTAIRNLKSAFFKTPLKLDKGMREYPPRPAACVEERKTLNTEVKTAATVMVNTNETAVHRIYSTIRDDHGDQDGEYMRYKIWAAILRHMHEFYPLDVYRERGVPVSSGDRMTIESMNRYPSREHHQRFDDMFRANAGPLLTGLVVRALHRWVNNMVFKNFDLVGTSVNDRHTFAINNPALDKADMSREFLHNSQRGYWDQKVLKWAREIALPQAIAAVTDALVRIDVDRLNE